ncbi:Serine/threonine-protein phosphatase 7 long form homolog [Linum grandiflorum]
MEHWRSETNTFHMYHGECTITLQDVVHLTGLPVTDDALYVEYEKDTNWAAIVEEVLGKSPGGHLKGDRRVKMGWLHDHFYSCTDVADDDETQLLQYARAYMLSIIGGFMLPDKSSAYMHCKYILAFRERRPFAWGAAVLSWMYRELGRVTFKIEGGPMSTSAGDIGGWMVLLQTLCLERFLSIAWRMHERCLRRPQSRVPPLIAINKRRILLIFQSNCVDGRTGSTIRVVRHLSVSSDSFSTRGLDFK